MLKIPHLVLVLMTLFSTLAFGQTIKVAAIDWCPQICIDKKQKGYVVDYVNEIFKDSGYVLDIEYYPWSRAIKQVRTGKVHALLSPAKAEAPSLLFPRHEVGSQSMCFITLAESDWRYQGIDSLKNMQIGVAIDASIEELNDYVEKNPTQFQFQPYHERFLIQNANKLRKGRMDAFVFTKNTTKYELSRAGIWEQYREAGCVNKADIYMAFSPHASIVRETKVMLDYFDKRVDQLKVSKFLEGLLKSYQL